MKKILLSLSLILVISCNKQSNDTIEEINISEEVVSNSNNRVVRIWSSEDLKLPKGLVIKLDCANCGSSNGNKDLSDNYVTIKNQSGRLIIIRDIDIDTYLNLHEGDSIN